MGIWRVVKELNYPLHNSLRELSVAEYPHSVSYVIKRRMQIDSYFELPEDKRPPRSIWDRPSELEEWFGRAFSNNEKQTEFTIPINEDEIER